MQKIYLIEIFNAIQSKLNHLDLYQQSGIGKCMCMCVCIYNVDILEHLMA